MNSKIFKCIDLENNATVVGCHENLIFYNDANKVTKCVAENNQLIAYLSGHKSGITTFTVSENRVYSGSVDGTTNVFENSSTGYKWIQSLPGRYQINSISSSFSVNNSANTAYLVAGNNHGGVAVWNTKTLLSSWTCPNADSKCIYSSIISSNDVLFGGFNRIYIYDLPSGSHITSLGGHSGPVLALTHFDSLCTSHNTGMVFASGGEDKKIHIWNLDTFSLIRTCLGHSSAVTCLATTIKPVIKQALLISGSRDRTIRIWDFLMSNNCVYILRECTERIVSLSVTPTLQQGNMQPNIKVQQQKCSGSARSDDDNISSTSLQFKSTTIEAMEQPTTTTEIVNTDEYKSHKQPNILLVATAGGKTLYIWNLTTLFNWERRRNYLIFLSGYGLLRPHIISDINQSSAMLTDKSVVGRNKSNGTNGVHSNIDELRDQLKEQSLSDTFDNIHETSILETDIQRMKIDIPISDSQNQKIGDTNISSLESTTSINHNNSSHVVDSVHRYYYSAVDCCFAGSPLLRSYIASFL